MTGIKTNYDRVTSVLRPFSGIDKVPKEILEAANDRGRRVHALCQGYIEGIEVLPPDDLVGYVNSFLKWSSGKNFHHHPGRSYDEDLRITGEIDGIFTQGRDIYIFDFKTSTKEGSTWKYQGASYSHIVNGYRGIDQMFVMLDKHGGYPKEYIYKYKDNIDTFLKCLDLYREFFKTKREMEIEFL